MSVEICTLGTASGLPAEDRFGQTIVLTQPSVGDEPSGHLIFDTGDGASSLLMRHGFDHRLIQAIFISHMHADHHGGFAQVVKTCMHVHKEDELLVLAPDEGIPALQAYLEASYLQPEWLGFPIRWVPLAGTVGHTIALHGGARLRAYPNDHLAWVRQRIVELPGRRRAYTFESYSAVYEDADTRIVYSGNLHGPAGSDEMVPFVEPCDLLIDELAHVDPVELGRFLAGRRINHTVVTHLHPQWNGVPDAEILAKIQRGAGATGIPGKVTIARDGDRFTASADA